MILNIDIYFIIIQIIYIYLIYLIFLYNYIYIYNIISFLIVLLFSLLLSYKNNDFLASIILLIEILVFLIIIIFSFFNNSWINTYKFKNNLLTMLLFIYIYIYFYYNNIIDNYFILFNKKNYILSDLNLLFINCFYSYMYFFFITFYIITIIGIFILFILKINKNIVKYNLFRIIKFQNNYKQSWRFGGTKIFKN